MQIFKISNVRMKYLNNQKQKDKKYSRTILEKELTNTL